MNIAILVGTVVDAPKIKSMPSGGVIVSLRVKTSRSWQGKEFAQFHNVSLFGKDAEQVASSLAPGDMVSVNGEISNRSYEKEGQKIWVTEIKAQTAERLSQASVEHGFAQPPGGVTAEDYFPF
jgi:single-strand DNA-binding protein